MTALASEGIPYIRDKANVYLPFLGMAASPVPTVRPARPLSPHAQRMVLNLISGRWDGMSAGDLAAAAGVSRSTVTNCLAEIQAIMPAVISTEWKYRVLRNPGMPKDQLLGEVEPYLISPVRHQTMLKGQEALDALREQGALLSGESALSYYSDLSHGSGPVHLAVHYKDFPQVVTAAGSLWVEAKWFDQPDVIVEQWAYRLDGQSDVSEASTGFSCIDGLGLYAQMRNTGEDDVRLADAVAQLREAACQ